ncbi:hypothetical protein C882_1801 [Caenispirillum salinarum AK4]|uniref:Amidoligase enzyme n=1 Tax=Caenispirillum salinarum AK4 TaxID=1238182 RepID=K9GRD5_9PROT|nr:amidoligase family protein [Caenispirillum salinarum]EKV27299.1 hypothetical protein C882_1801 [Caenispirillum salinarum AK4]
MQWPPERTVPDGRERRVGIELEFAGVTARDAADLVAELFGGRVEECDPHRFVVRDTALGSFETELDSQYVHPEDKTVPGITDSKAAQLAQAVWERAADVMADAARHWLPVEVVSPPMPLSDIPRFDGILRSLRERGAEGTRDSVVYAFALQLNPEVARADVAWITGVVRAYALLEDWLKLRIHPDPLRRVLRFAAPWPLEYKSLVLAPDYAPDLATLIDDYARFNETRNRGLDLWPLFAHLDPGRVAARIDDPLIKPRPTFHYRLPDARLSDPGWSVITEWNDWVRVERLAADTARLEALADEWRRHAAAGGSGTDWARTVCTRLEEA